ncbi:EthD domain-containing protein [Amycolatopsis rhabdoformis]|uniref:EthD domain-containing protein n=1 Tax=Amycolatopsis rhabdoformis TaxID=1448059 RepID=A0ABZ1IKJ2_9PSEU|nr:EthD domain-containing protein [Amycolatopsis rhabdoformis]WSE34700.1 EthD domain-containing protein [Amycolatopsis rhabdoformis]
MVKLVILLKRAPGMSLEEFAAYHRDHHAVLIDSVPETARYIRKSAFSYVADDSAPYDGIVEIWFESDADRVAFFSSESYQNVIRPDEKNFVDPDSVALMVTTERITIGA